MYAISIEGKIKATTNDWDTMMQMFRLMRKETDKPVLMVKINKKGEIEE